MQFCSVPSDPHGPHPGFDELASGEERVGEGLDDQLSAHNSWQRSESRPELPKTPTSKKYPKNGTRKHGAAEKKQERSVGRSSPRQRTAGCWMGNKPLVHSSPGTPWIHSASAGLLTGSCCLALVVPFFSELAAVPFPSFVVIVRTGRGMGPWDRELLLRTPIL